MRDCHHYRYTISQRNGMIMQLVNIHRLTQSIHCITQILVYWSSTCPWMSGRLLKVEHFAHAFTLLFLLSAEPALPCYTEAVMHITKSLGSLVRWCDIHSYQFLCLVSIHDITAIICTSIALWWMMKDLSTGHFSHHFNQKVATLIASLSLRCKFTFTLTSNWY